MKLQNLILKGLLCLSLGVFFASCDDNDDKTPQGTIIGEGVFILNAGSYQTNNSNFGYYDFDSKTFSSNVFREKNKKDLGDTGQDMLIYGSKIYVSVTESNVIFVLDRQGNIVREIAPLNAANQPMKPRSLVAHNGKVYASLQSGDVARIDTAYVNSAAAVISIDYAKVGAYPEQMAVSNNKLYVANSGLGAGTTLSVLDLNNFEAPAQSITVRLNPSNMLADGKGNIYFISLGNHQPMKNMLLKLDTSGKITEIGDATQMAISGSRIYIIYNGYTSDWTSEPAAFSWYDINTGELHKERFVAEKDNNGKAIDLSKAVAISIDPVSKNIYIGTSDFVSTGDMYIFSSTGSYIKSFDTGGMNPMGAYYINNK